MNTESYKPGDENDPDKELFDGRRYDWSGHKTGNRWDLYSKNYDLDVKENPCKKSDYEGYRTYYRRVLDDPDAPEEVKKDIKRQQRVDEYFKIAGAIFLLMCGLAILYWVLSSP